MILSSGTPLVTRLRMSKKSSFPPADIFDVVEAATPREVAAESTAGLTWDVLEQAESQVLLVRLEILVLQVKWALQGRRVLLA